MALTLQSFAVDPNDPSDVVAGLVAASAAFKRGDRREALRSLRAAVEAASEAEQDERALALAKIAADLATHLASLPPPKPSEAPSPPASQGPTAPTPPATQAPQAKRPDRKSVTNEASRAKGRGDHAPQAPAAGARKRSSSRTDKLESGRPGNLTDEIDGWPTEVVHGDRLPDRQHPRVSGVPTKVRGTQALRVRLWRDRQGGLRIQLADGDAPEGSVEAMLVELDADDRLVELLIGAR